MYPEEDTNAYKRTWMHFAAVLLAFGLVAAACGDDDEDAAAPDTAAAPEATTAPSDEAPAPDDTDTAPADDDEEAPAPTTTAVPVVEGELADVCPSPLVVQTDWFPESEHGAMYEVVGADHPAGVCELRRLAGPLGAPGPIGRHALASRLIVCDATRGGSGSPTGVSSKDRTAVSDTQQAPDPGRIVPLEGI